MYAYELRSWAAVDSTRIQFETKELFHIPYMVRKKKLTGNVCR